ncbi:Cytochrome b5, putative [Theobroma cacao]|uniref:Cytochrome b5, putative n=1 Tax=Theobroma cacao TaxID=3641 RepID=A0A061EH97_THECC|nr:Cytochrome b5, putative [Theobroma cacao]
MTVTLPKAFKVSCQAASRLPSSTNLWQGKDATDDFEDAGHSKSAKELMQNFCVGELDTPSAIIPELEISSKKETADYSQKLMDLTKQYWGVPVAVVGISVVVGFLYLRKK